MTGKVNVGGVRKAVLTHETRSRSEAEREELVLSQLRNFRSPICFIYGTRDPDTEMAGANYRKFCDRHGIPYEFHPIVDANHSFYSLKSEQQVVDLTSKWLMEHT